MRVAVVGTGMGQHHLRSAKETPGVERVAAVDIDEQRLNESCDKWGIEHRYTSLEEMLDRETPDVVGVATPNHTHREVAVTALAAGAHVFCEKPMALNAREADEMNAAARKAGRRIMIGFNQRFTEPAWALKQEIDQGTLGDMYFGQTMWLRRYGMPKFGGWFGQKALSGGGPLIDLGVHRIDLALWLMGYPEPEWVLARTYDHLAAERAASTEVLFDVEDLATAFITFRNGASLQASASWAGHIREKELMETRVMGTRGGLLHRNLEEGYRFEADLLTTRGETQYDMRIRRCRNAPRSAIGHFIECIREDRPHVATGEEGAAMMRILDAVYASAERREPVRVEWNAPPSRQSEEG